jgi:hypothetical protein
MTRKLEHQEIFYFTLPYNLKIKGKHRDSCSINHKVTLISNLFPMKISIKLANHSDIAKTGLLVYESQRHNCILNHMFCDIHESNIPRAGLVKNQTLNPSARRHIL